MLNMFCLEEVVKRDGMLKSNGVLENLITEKEKMKDNEVQVLSRLERKRTHGNYVIRRKMKIHFQCV